MVRAGWALATVVSGLVTAGLVLSWPAAQAEVAPSQAEALQALGNTLFHDARLSTDGTVSCASCHQAQHAFTDGRAVAQGVRKQLGLRNAQSLLNVGHLSSYFWDGRRATLEEQVLDPLVNGLEHGFPSHADVLAVVNADAGYRKAFAQAFAQSDGQPIGQHELAKALAAFVRTLVSPESAIDRFVLKGDQKALGPEARAGFDVFNKALCAGCHTLTADPYTGLVLLSDDKFHASGATAESLRKTLESMAQDLVANNVSLQTLDSATADPLGRFMVTGNPVDAGAFKTPSLRNVSRTGPYFHDGSSPTLEHAMDRELTVATGSITLTPQERRQLLAFLRALDDDSTGPAGPQGAAQAQESKRQANR